MGRRFKTLVQEAHLKSSSKCSTWGDANQQAFLKGQTPWRDSLLTMSRPSLLCTVIIQSSIHMSKSSGIIPAPIPCIWCRPFSPPQTKKGTMNFTACKLVHSLPNHKSLWLANYSGWINTMRRNQPDRTALSAGWTVPTWMLGFFLFWYWPAPVTVPPVPHPATKMSTFPAVASHSSAPAKDPIAYQAKVLVYHKNYMNCTEEACVLIYT